MRKTKSRNVANTKEGAKKKSGGGPPDLSGAGSREWVSSLKGPSSTRKNAPSPVRY